MPTKRRKLRESIFKVLFQYDFQGDNFSQIMEEEVKKLKDSALKKEAEEHLKRIYENLPKIDETISKYLENWEFDRLSYVDRNILRLGTYELIYVDNVPFEVTLDEMIEIAKVYGTEESGKFVNGILDRIGKNEAPKEKFSL